MKNWTLFSWACCVLCLEAGTTRSQELAPPPLADGTEPMPIEAPAPQIVSVDLKDRAAVVQLYQTTYLASEGVAAGWTGNRSTCTAGTTSQAYSDATILRVNYYRAMAGLPGNVLLTNTWNREAQQAALMMSSQGALSHSPPTNWSCYTAAGAEAAGRSNLALGADAASAIDLYMDDPGSGGNAAVGHRRWILYPPTQVMGAGNIPATGGWAANDLWVIGGAGSRPAQPAWVSWPPPGFVPWQIMPATSGRWSFSYAGATFSGATVYMQHAGTNVTLSLEAQAQGYGDNTIVWVPQGISYSAPAADLTYSVTVSNVVVSGLAKAFSYNITIIDPDVPALGVTLGPTNSLSLSWPSANAGYSVQQNSALGNASGWTNVPLTPQLIGNQYTAKPPILPGQHYYRLVKP